MAEFVKASSSSVVSVRSPDRDRLSALLAEQGYEVTTEPEGSLAVRGTDAPAVGAIAARHGIELHELVARDATLEQAFMEQTRETLDY